MSNEERERRLPKWARDELRDLRMRAERLETELQVRRNECVHDPLGGESKIVACLHHEDHRAVDREVELPTHNIRFYTQHGTFDVRTPVFDHEQGIRVSCDGITIHPEVSNVVTITGRTLR
jgi:hypothetical protein